VEKHNPEDNLNYWVYNNEYFEKDKKNQDWSRLPDLYSDALPFDNN